VIDETWEMVEHGLVNLQDFRKFVFGNAARMYTAMNPDFFKGTVVEGAVEEELRGASSKASPEKVSHLSAHDAPAGRSNINALLTRVSALRLSEEELAQSDLDLILESGLRVADHGRLRPWEFVVVRGAARAALGKAFAEGLSERVPSTDERGLAAERAKAVRAPVIVVVVAKTKESANVPQVEQVVSAGGAAQNMLVAAHGLGLGGFWRTGSAAYSPHVKQVLELDEKDLIVGFLYLGHVAAAGKLRDAVPAGAVREWTGG
jgi:nitroreductase